MKRLLLLLGALAALVFTSEKALSQANVQIIHNSADPAAAVVDIYVNGSKTGLDDVPFRAATPFLPLPSGVDINVSINGSMSADVDDQVIKTFNLGQLADGNYIVVANGVADATGYQNPEMSRDIELNLYPTDGKLQATNSSKVDLKVFHGVTDAPAVDIYLKSLSRFESYPDNPQVAGLNYGNATQYLELEAEIYAIKVTAAGNPDVVVNEYLAPLTTARGFGAMVVASGFLSTQDEPSGVSPDASFALNVITPQGNNGNPLLLPTAEFAKVQVLHNSPDPAAEVVDIYINGVKPDILDDFEYLDATPYVEVLATGQPLGISINGPGSTDSGDQLVENFSLPALEAGKEYVAIANGVVGTEFMSGAQGRDISLDLIALEGLTEASQDDLVAINAFHGSTDAPAVDIYADINGQPLVPNLDFGNASGWVEVADEDITLTVTAAGDKNVVAGEFIAPLSVFNGQSLFVFASGFLSPDDENGMDGVDNRDFGLYAMTAEGEVIPLPQLTDDEFAYVQVIHNSPNPAAETVDVYVNGMKPDQLDDFMFRTATEYMEVPSGTPITVSVNLPNSMDVTDGVVESFELGELEAGMEYVVVANGANVLPGDNFNAGAMGRDISFTLVPLAGQSFASEDDLVAVNAFHGSTDAPAVDIYADINAQPLIPNLDYGNASGWVELPDTDAILTVTVAGDPSTEAGVFNAPLSAFGGESLFIFASGFLTAGDEPGMPMGRDFGLFVATESGTVVQLSPAGSVYADNANTDLFPNPATQSVNIISLDAFNQVEIISSSGNIVRSEDISGGTGSFAIENLNLTPGNYFVIVKMDGNIVSLEKLQIRK
ncbi:MAG: hypothetical protein Kapaf2KO_02810 [Candidatus Kapaibacteriales bacterium]